MYELDERILLRANCADGAKLLTAVTADAVRVVDLRFLFAFHLDD